MTPTKLETATPHTLPSPHEPRGTSNIEHPTPNIEWQRESSLSSAFGVRCWTFDVFPWFRGSNARIFISRINPLNRSSRREEALTSFNRNGMSLLTSAATRFMGREIFPAHL